MEISPGQPGNLKKLGKNLLDEAQNNNKESNYLIVFVTKEKEKSVLPLCNYLKKIMLLCQICCLWIHGDPTNIEEQAASLSLNLLYKFCIN